jgi:hypothetical protein
VSFNYVIYTSVYYMKSQGEEEDRGRLRDLSYITKGKVFTWHVLRKREGCTRYWWGNLRERDHWVDQGVGGRIILRCIFRKWEGVVGTGWSGLRIRTDGGRL